MAQYHSTFVFDVVNGMYKECKKPLMFHTQWAKIALYSKFLGKPLKGEDVLLPHGRISCSPLLLHVSVLRVGGGRLNFNEFSCVIIYAVRCQTMGF